MLRGWLSGPRGYTCVPPPARCPRVPAHSGQDTDAPRCLQIDYYCRLDCLWKTKFKKEHEEFETMENVNCLLLFPSAQESSLSLTDFQIGSLILFVF